MTDTRVIFDISPVPHAVGGVARYLGSLSEALVKTAPDAHVDLSVLDVLSTHPGVPSPGIECMVLKTPLYMKVPLLRRIPIRYRWEESSRPGRLSSAFPGKCVIHHSGVQPLCPPGWVSVVTVYDLSALENPQWHTEATVEYAEREWELIRSGSFVAAISKWTASRVAETFKMPEDRIYVMGGAVDESFFPSEPSLTVMSEYGLEPGRYFLHVGSFVPRKNIPFLVDLYRDIRGETMGMPLVLAGTGGWGGMEPVEEEGIRILRDVPEESMPHLYRGARALLCPSRYEGLGLPVMEAMACGTPVLSSNSAALTDTVGDGGILLDPIDGNGWKREILQLMNDSRMLQLREMALSSERRSWKDVAMGLCGFYRRIAKT